MNARLLSFFGFFVAIILSLSLFKVDERECAVVLEFGKIKRIVNESGLHAKIPLIEKVLFFDRRIHVLDHLNPERFITSEKKNINIDSFLKWRIIDPRLFLTTMNGNISFAELRLTQTTNSALREEVGKFRVHDVISGQRDEIMRRLRTRSDNDARQFGVTIIDLRLRRVEFPPEVSESVFRRMQAERERVANQLRAQGVGESEKIRADADKQSMIILADAYRRAAELKGKGDAVSARIYASSFGQDPEFFRFYKSMDVYQSAFHNKSDVLIVTPALDAFKYLKEGSHKPKQSV